MTLRLLVAEDNRANRILVETYLRKFGFVPTVVINGADAVNAVQCSNFDLALMDIQMPVMDGLEATRRIRALDGRAASLPVLALTASVLEADASELKGAGFNGIVGKPIDPQDLYGKIVSHASV